MPLKTKQPGQFMVLMAGDIDHSLLKRHNQNMTVANEPNDTLTLIATTQFDLILLDLTVDCSVASVPDRLRHFHHPWQSVASVPDRLRHFHHPWQSELIAHIKNPAGINNKTPVIAIINPAEESQRKKQFPIEFDDWLIKPITEERLNGIIDRWQTKASALDYIQIILSKTKNNQALALTIFEKLFGELPVQIIHIKDALENSRYDLAREITHKLNGSVSFCGLLDMQQSANALESCLLNNAYANAHQHVLALQQHILDFTRHQKTILASLGEP